MFPDQVYFHNTTNKSFGVRSFATYAYSYRSCPLEFFKLFLGLETIKIPSGKCDSYTCMLQMNPPLVSQSNYRKLPLIDPAIYNPPLSPSPQL